MVPAAELNTPAARDERELRWREKRIERRKDIERQYRRNRDADQHRKAIDAQRERDWQERQKALQPPPAPDTDAPAD